jgi:two-component system response regulator FlrC
LSGEALQRLTAHSWAGNIRELQNVMERALILAENTAEIRPEHLLLVESCRTSSLVHTAPPIACDRVKQ